MAFICITLLAFSALSRIKIHHSHIKAWPCREQDRVGIGGWLEGERQAGAVGLRAPRASRCAVTADRVHGIGGRGRGMVMLLRGTIARNLVVWDRHKHLEPQPVCLSGAQEE